jgi:hypothetical protein
MSRTSMVGGEQSRKEPIEQLVNSYSEHLRMSARPVENARDNNLLCPGWVSHSTLFFPNLFLYVNLRAEHEHSRGSLLAPIIGGVERKDS